MQQQTFTQPVLPPLHKFHRLLQAFKKQSGEDKVDSGVLEQFCQIFCPCLEGFEGTVARGDRGDISCVLPHCTVNNKRRALFAKIIPERKRRLIQN